MEPLPLLQVKTNADFLDETGLKYQRKWRYSDLLDLFLPYMNAQPKTDREAWTDREEEHAAKDLLYMECTHH